MTYFNHYEITPGLGLREEIDLILASDCVTGDGIEKESNYYELEAWGLKSLVPASTRWILGNTGSHATTWKLAPKVTGADMKQLIEALEWLTESPILSETRYSDMCWEQGRKLLEYEAQSAGVNPEVFADLATDDFDVHFYSEDGEVTYDMSVDTFNALIEQTKRDSQTDHAHYYGGQFHSPEHCTRCQEFPELIGARA